MKMAGISQFKLLQIIDSSLHMNDGGNRVYSFIDTVLSRYLGTQYAAVFIKNKLKCNRHGTWVVTGM